MTTLISNSGWPQNADDGAFFVKLVAGNLRASSLPDRRNWLDAVPRRFSRALDEVGQLLESKALRVILPNATIRNEEELHKWIGEVKKLAREKLKVGPIIV